MQPTKRSKPTSYYDASYSTREFESFTEPSIDTIDPTKYLDEARALERTKAKNDYFMLQLLIMSANMSRLRPLQSIDYYNSLEEKGDPEHNYFEQYLLRCAKVSFVDSFISGYVRNKIIPFNVIEKIGMRTLNTTKDLLYALETDIISWMLNDQAISERAHKCLLHILNTSVVYVITKNIAVMDSTLLNIIKCNNLTKGSKMLREYWNSGLNRDKTMLVTIVVICPEGREHIDLTTEESLNLHMFRFKDGKSYEEPKKETKSSKDSIEEIAKDVSKDIPEDIPKETQDVSTIDSNKTVV
jgi:hypothetical protein